MILAPFSSCCSCSFRSKKGSNVLFPGALPLASAGVGALEHTFTIFHLYNIHNFCTSLLTRAKRFWGRPPAILGDGAANQFRHRWSHLCRSLSETPRVRFAAPLRRCERRLRREASRWCRTGLTGLISHPKTIGTRPVTLEHEPNDAGWLWQRNSSWRPPSIPGCLPGTSWLKGSALQPSGKATVPRDTILITDISSLAMNPVSHPFIWGLSTK